jgi:hypothetical protein
MVDPARFRAAGDRTEEDRNDGGPSDRRSSGPLTRCRVVRPACSLSGGWIRLDFERLAIELGRIESIVRGSIVRAPSSLARLAVGRSKRRDVARLLTVVRAVPVISISVGQLSLLADVAAGRR